MRNQPAGSVRTCMPSARVRSYPGCLLGTRSLSTSAVWFFVKLMARANSFWPQGPLMLMLPLPVAAKAVSVSVQFPFAVNGPRQKPAPIIKHKTNQKVFFLIP